MKKLTFLTAMFLLSFTLSVGAAGQGETFIQERQKAFLDTADVRYAPYHGKLEVNTSLGSGYNRFLDEVVTKNAAPNLLIEYSPMKNLQVDAVLAASATDIKALGVWYDQDANLVYGDAKYKFYDNSKLELAAKGFVESRGGKLSATDENGTELVFDDTRNTAYGAALLSNYNLKNGYALYNNLGLTTMEGINLLGMTTGFQARVTPYHQFMGKFDSSLNLENETVYNNAALMYIAYLNRNMTNLLETNYNVNTHVVNVENTTQIQVMPTALVTTHLSYNNDANGQNGVGIDAEKEFGPLTVKAGMSHKFEKGALDPRTTFKGGAAYDVNKKLEVSVEMERELIDPAGDNNHITKAKLGLKADL